MRISPQTRARHRPAKPYQILAISLAAYAILAWVAPNGCWGGLSSSDVVVVVNANSEDSRTLANYFVELRHIPPPNVVVLPDVPASEVASVDDFREKILRPLLLELQRRRLLDHIQCVAYSADFPSAIDISSDLKDIQNLHFAFTPVASINSLTYLYAQVLNRDPSYIGLNANFYARRAIDTYFTNPAGTLTQSAWDEAQILIKSDKHLEAANALEKLLQEQPHQFPIAYLAAAEAAAAGDKPRAIKLLQAAIAAGWSCSRYLAKDERFASLRDDPDFQVIELTLDDSIKELQPATGFDARQPWAPNGVPAAKVELGQRYLLSTVLGVTRGAGTSLPQAIAALKRSAAADYTHPQGGFYFCLTDDVRTSTRQWGFIGAVDDLQKMGFEAAVVPRALPEGKKNVLGVQLGTPVFDWNLSRSELAAGAIAENLTSLGGVMTPGSGQTNLSELIKAGAAASSGAVTEPYSLQEKFPHPNMYVQYARGASLAEAFYLSVTGPYQLLIVGDPLCQPFSNAPQVSVEPKQHHLEKDQSLGLVLTNSDSSYSDWLDSEQPVAKRTEPLAAVSLRAMLDGANPQSGPIRRELNISLKGVPPGYHEIVLQFQAEGPLAQRSTTIVPVWIGPQKAIQTSVNGAEPNLAHYQVTQDKQKISVQVSAEQGQRVSLWHDSEQLSTAPGKTAEFAVELKTLGSGPVRLQGKAELEDGKIIQSQPMWIDVLP